LIILACLVTPLPAQEPPRDESAPSGPATTQRASEQGGGGQKAAGESKTPSLQTLIPEEIQIAETLAYVESKSIRLPVSLQDAIRVAIQNNLNVQSEKYVRDIARRQIIIEKAAFDPFFNLSFTYADNREPSVSQLDFDPLNPVLGVEVNPFDITTLRSGLRGTTLLGTSYQLSIAENRFNAEESSIFALNPRYSTRVEFSAIQPLLKDAWYDFNSANIRIAKNNLQMSQAQFQLTAIETILSVINAYWELVFAHKNTLSKASALKVAREQLRIDTRRQEAGALAKIDLITPESQVARRKTEFDQAITILENARDRLLVLMNYTGKDSLRKLWDQRDEKSPFDNILMLPTTEPETELFIPDRNESLTRAFQLRQEYVRAELQTDTQNILVDVAKNQLLPALDLSATWAQLGLERDLDGSLDEFDSGRYYDWQVGLSLEIPLAFRQPLNRLRNARDEYQRLLLQKQSVENAIVVEVDQAIRDIQSSHRSVLNLHQEVVLQEALLEAEKAKLRVGKSIAYTVSQIENDLVEIQAQEILAKTNFEKFKAAYQRSIGQLLEAHGIVFDE
jgi:outer membrane protein TolC